VDDHIVVRSGTTPLACMVCYSTECSLIYKVWNLRGILVICPMPLYHICQAGSYQIGGMVIGMAVMLAHPYHY